MNHPVRETNYMCSKYGRYFCEECLACRDPKIYCKFRSACSIWFLNKGVTNLEGFAAEKSLENQEENDDSAGSEFKEVSISK